MSDSLKPIRDLFLACDPNQKLVVRKTSKDGATEIEHIKACELNRLEGIVAGCPAQNLYLGIGVREEHLAFGKIGNKEQITGIPGFFFDVDIVSTTRMSSRKYAHNIDAARKVLDKSRLKFALTMHSGGGLHLVLKLDEFWTFQNDSERNLAHQINQGLQRHLRGVFNESGYDIDEQPLTAQFRIPGSLNLKGEPVEVTILESDFTRCTPRSDLEEFAAVEAQSPQPKVTGKFPPADIEPIMEGCAFMRHVRDDAKNLPETEWQASMSVLAFCENGEAIAHEFSKPYPRYSHAETQRKFEAAKKFGKPRTCKNISKETHGVHCRGCAANGCIKTPVQLGQTRPETTKEDDKDSFGIGELVNVLESHPAFKGVLAWDQMALEVVKLKRAPFDDGDDSVKPWEDIDDIRTEHWLYNELKRKVSDRDIYKAVNIAARKNSIHAIRDYIMNLKWDGVERVPHWASTYLGVEDNEYSRLVSRCFFIAPVARVIEPGTKVDIVPILEGDQGLGKSTVLKILASEPYYADTVVDLSSKDGKENLRGVWFYELPEIDTMNSVKIKGIVSSCEDRFRPSYGRRSARHPRQVFFVGTTNHEEYLVDITGGRRYLPLRCTRIDLDALQRDRDQLWAEAFYLYEQGHKWYPDTPHEKEVCLFEQELRREKDPLEEKIDEYLKGKDIVTVKEIMESFGCVEDKRLQTKIGQILLHTLGWEKSRRMIAGSRANIYVRPGKKEAEPVEQPQKSVISKITLNMNSEPGYAAI